MCLWRDGKLDGTTVCLGEEAGGGWDRIVLGDPLSCSFAMHFVDTAYESIVITYASISILGLSSEAIWCSIGRPSVI